jgi:hypothetical protein
LVIGSMAPDFGYFLHRFPMAGRAHTLEGSLTVALPLALLVWCACRAFADFLVRPLPERLGAATRSLLAGSPWTRWTPLWVFLSLLLAIWSHNLLDSFTHDSGWVVRRVAFLHEPWPIYHVLQQIGSIAGVLVLAILHWRWSQKTPGPRICLDRKLLALLLVAALALLLAVLPSWNFAERFKGGYEQFRAFRFRWVVKSMAFAACGYLILALWLQLGAWRSQKSN